MNFIIPKITPRAISTNTLIIAALFITLTIILTHIFAIQTPFIRISFGFLPIAVFAAVFGPFKAGLVAAIADVIGCLIFSPGLYFPGFTLSAFIAGMIYGFFLYKKPPSVKRIFWASFLILIVVDLCLNTLWLTFLYHKAAQTIIAGRFVKGVLMLPLHVFVIYAVYKRLCKQKLTNMLKTR